MECIPIKDADQKIDMWASCTMMTSHLDDVFSLMLTQYLCKAMDCFIFATIQEQIKCSSVRMVISRMINKFTFQCTVGRNNAYRNMIMH